MLLTTTHHDPPATISDHDPAATIPDHDPNPDFRPHNRTTRGRQLRTTREER